MLRECSTRASILRCGQLNCHDIGICEMPARATSIGTVSTNATGRYAFRLCLFCTGAVHACPSPGVLTNKSFKVFVNQVTFVGNSLVDMYTKCGSLDNTQGVFNKMPGFGMP
jgi:hypothetical protein